MRAWNLQIWNFENRGKMTKYIEHIIFDIQLFCIEFISEEHILMYMYVKFIFMKTNQTIFHENYQLL